MTPSLKAVVLLPALLATPALAGTVWLDDLETNQLVQPWGIPHRNLSVDRTPLKIADKIYANGLGVQGSSEQWISLGRGTNSFKCLVGLDDVSGGEAEFIIAVDGQRVFQSGPMKKGDAAKPVELELKNKSYMLLAVRGNAKADWVDAKFDTAWSEPMQAVAAKVEPYVLTPLPRAEPKLNNALRYGARPGAPFHYTIPCTGERPMKFSATGLPPGLTLDADKGWIAGKVDAAGSFKVQLTATNAKGKSERALEIVIGDKLSLTPPLGWSSWNAWCAEPSQQRAQDAADSMVKFDLINHGYAFVNIDDGWQALRGGTFNGIQTNEKKFPDIKALIQNIHSMGLKFGIYSGPWVCSYCGYCGGSSDDPKGAWDPKLRDKDNGWYFGKYNLAENDAKEWTAWGIDYLKYDWYPNKEPEIAKMSDALRATGRDVVYSVSNSAKVTEADALTKYAQLWRASGDIRDTWLSLRLNGFGANEWAGYSQPGGWPDADMLVVGHVGFGPDGWGQYTHASYLTPDEQYTHMSLWSLLASPLILGCDLTKLDPFTVGLITNDEVLDVDQDPLGKAARKIVSEDFYEVWSRPLHDGATAAGLFNVSPTKMKLKLKSDELKLSGRFKVRDLWRQQDLGELKDGMELEVPGHGVRLVKLTPMP